MGEVSKRVSLHIGSLSIAHRANRMRSRAFAVPKRWEICTKKHVFCTPPRCANLHFGTYWALFNAEPIQTPWHHPLAIPIR